MATAHIASSRQRLLPQPSSEPFSQEENTMWSSIILQSPIDPPTIMIDTSAAPSIETAASTGAKSSVSFSIIRMSKD
ncbi:hypothetical protein IAS59_005971 [Cryptococcus gattii]